MRPAAGRAPTRRGRWTREGEGEEGRDGAARARRAWSGRGHRRRRGRTAAGRHASLAASPPAAAATPPRPPAERRNRGVGGATATREIERRGAAGCCAVGCAGWAAAFAAAAFVGGALCLPCLEWWWMEVGRQGPAASLVWGAVSEGTTPQLPGAVRAGVSGALLNFRAPSPAGPTGRGPPPPSVSWPSSACVAWGKTLQAVPARLPTSAAERQHAHPCHPARVNTCAPHLFPPPSSSAAAADGTLSRPVGRVPLCPACPVPHPRAPLRPGSARPGASPPHHPSPHFPAQRRVAAA